MFWQNTDADIYGFDTIGESKNAEQYLAGTRTNRRNKLKRRSVIEPTIGHVKSDNRMDRNFSKSHEGDRLNAILAAAGYNMRKLIAAFLYALIKFICFLQNQLCEMVECLCRPSIVRPNL